MIGPVRGGHGKAPPRFQPRPSARERELNSKGAKDLGRRVYLERARARAQALIAAPARMYKARGQVVSDHLQAVLTSPLPAPPPPVRPHRRRR